MTADRPTLLLLRRTRADLPEFVLGHLRDQVSCLEQWFDVVLVDGDCDYDRLCDEHEPDLAIFETGVYTRPVHEIAHIGAAPGVPKLGFIHSDAYCASRTRSINDMHRWGIEDYVTTALSMAEYTPALADRLFVWPNFVDASVFRDYALPKTVPVLLTGSHATNYPWRNEVSRAVTGRFPVMTTPHGGWFDRQSTARMVSGERYARLLNAAQVVPSCGTMAMELVRKHLEIPAAGTCLVAEPSAALTAAGFVDMVNCVLAESADVVDRLDHLFAHPDELAAITEAGHDLVHARHTSAQRDEIKRWFDLRIALRPGERVVFPAPFTAPVVAGPQRPAVNGHTIGAGRDRVLLRTAGRRLADGDVPGAEDAYRRCLNYHFMPEPVVGLARARLDVGDPAGALRRLDDSLDIALNFHRTEPDPSEWALWIRAQLCARGLRAAVRHASAYPDLHSPELDRIRLAVCALAEATTTPSIALTADPGRPGLHAEPELAVDVWVYRLGRHLRLAGRPALAARIEEFPLSMFAVEPAERPGAGGAHPARLHSVPFRIRRRIRSQARRVIEARRTKGEFGARMYELVATEDLRTVVVIGGDRHDRVAEALADGARVNPDPPELLWIGRHAALDRLGRTRAGSRDSAELARARALGALDHTDLLVVLDPDRAAGLRPAEIADAGVVALRDTATESGVDLLIRVRGGLRHRVHDHDLDDAGGYAILRAVDCAPRRTAPLRVVG